MANVNKINIRGTVYDIEDEQARSALQGKQPKTLETPVIIGGQLENTVENTLQAVANILNKNSSVAVGQPASGVSVSSSNGVQIGNIVFLSVSLNFSAYVDSSINLCKITTSSAIPKSTKQCMLCFYETSSGVLIYSSYCNIDTDGFIKQNIATTIGIGQGIHALFIYAV